MPQRSPRRGSPRRHRHTVTAGGDLMDEIARTRVVLAKSERWRTPPATAAKLKDKRTQRAIAAQAERGAALQIQSVYRGSVGRAEAHLAAEENQLIAELAVDDAAATQIQSAFRGRRGRLEAEAQVEQEWEQLQEAQRKEMVEEDAETAVRLLEWDMAKLMSYSPPEPEPEPARPLPTNVHDRLADSSTFTGAHRQRFDPVTGKGRGLAGSQFCI